MQWRTFWHSPFCCSLLHFSLQNMGFLKMLSIPPRGCNVVTPTINKNTPKPIPATSAVLTHHLCSFHFHAKQQQQKKHVPMPEDLICLQISQLESVWVNFLMNYMYTAENSWKNKCYTNIKKHQKSPAFIGFGRFKDFNHYIWTLYSICITNILHFVNSLSLGLYKWITKLQNIATFRTTLKKRPLKPNILGPNNHTKSQKCPGRTVFYVF